MEKMEMRDWQNKLHSLKHTADAAAERAKEAQAAYEVACREYNEAAGNDRQKASV